VGEVEDGNLNNSGRRPPGLVDAGQDCLRIRIAPATGQPRVHKRRQDARIQPRPDKPKASCHSEGR